MRRVILLLEIVALAALLFINVSCESDDPVRGPDDGTSSIPWNRPQPGERTSPLAPFQSH